MEKNKVLILLLITAILSITLTYFFYQSAKIYSIKELKMDIIIGSYIGLNTDTDAIYFGTTLPGTSVNREIVLNTDKDIKVNLKLSGNISSFVQIPENNFRLNKDMQKSIKLRAIIPLNAAKGLYAGILKITFINN